MPKRLKSIYRSLTTPYRLRRLFNTNTVFFFLVTVAFLAAVFWLQPPGAGNEVGSGIAGAVQTLTPAPGPTRSATLSPEYIANADQTIGLTLVGALLVVIVVVGVLVFLPRHEDGV